MHAERPAQELNIRNSLRAKLALWIAIGACILTAIGAGISMGLGFNLLGQDFERNVRSHMQLASIALKTPVEQIDYLELREQAQAIMDYQDITGVRIMDHNQEVLLERGEFNGQTLREAIVSGEETLGWILVSFSQDQLISNMMYIFYAGAGLVLIFLPAFIYLVWRLSGKYLHDLSLLTDCIGRGTCSGLPQYPGLERKDEVGLLAGAIYDRDQDLESYHRELEAYKNHLEDMVEQRTLELKRSQLLSQSILNSIPDAIALVDTQNFAVLDANAVFLERYGVSLEEAVGQECYRLIYGYDQPCYHLEQTCPIQEYFRNNQPCILELEHRSKNDEAIHVEVSAWPVWDEQGEVKQMVHISRDITQRKRVEQLREDVERIVRHDLKTPLNGVIGMAELLADDDKLDSEQQEFAGHILESGRRMLHMINHSLDLYKMEEGTYQLSPQTFDLNQVLAHLSQETSRLRRARGLELEYYLDGEPHDPEQDQEISARGEKVNIQSMLANLIANALEASPEKSRVSVNIARSREELAVEIHNLGVVPEEIRDKFFERYATSGKTQGTGLGTYSARLIALSHGGDMGFSTSEEEGTRVWVRLPLEPGSNMGQA